MTEKEYDEKFKEYLKEKGPNPGATFFGSWGWYATMKNQFDREQNGQNGSEERTQNAT